MTVFLKPLKEFRKYHMKNGPQLFQRIFYWCSCKSKSVIGLDSLHRSCRLCKWVFKCLCFVKKHGVIGLFLEPTNILSQQRIGGNHNVCPSLFLLFSLPLFSTPID